jgi:hypothetical protein
MYNIIIPAIMATRVEALLCPLLNFIPF